MCGLAFAREVLLLNETSECFSNEKFVLEGSVYVSVYVYLCVRVSASFLRAYVYFVQ